MHTNMQPYETRDIPAQWFNHGEDSMRSGHLLFFS